MEKWKHTCNRGYVNYAAKSSGNDEYNHKRDICSYLIRKHARGRIRCFLVCRIRDLTEAVESVFVYTAACPVDHEVVVLLTVLYVANSPVATWPAVSGRRAMEIMRLQVNRILMSVTVHSLSVSMLLCCPIFEHLSVMAWYRSDSELGTDSESSKSNVFKSHSLALRVKFQVAPGKRGGGNEAHTAC